MTEPKACGHVEDIVHSIEWFDREGKTCCTHCFEAHKGDRNYVWVRQNTYGMGSDHEWNVSTVWTGEPRLVGEEGPHNIFETMVFAPGMACDLWQARWATEAEAIEGHEQMVALARRSVGIERATVDS